VPATRQFRSCRAAWLVVALVGCGGPADYPSFVAATRHQYCQHQVDCGFLDKAYETFCEESLTALGEAPTDHVLYDANAGRACLEAASAALEACTDAESFPPPAYRATACTGAVRGTVPDSQPCHYTDECTTGDWCVSGLNEAGEDQTLPMESRVLRAQVPHPDGRRPRQSLLRIDIRQQIKVLNRLGLRPRRDEASLYRLDVAPGEEAIDPPRATHAVGRPRDCGSPKSHRRGNSQLVQAEFYESCDACRAIGGRYPSTFLLYSSHFLWADVNPSSSFLASATRRSAIAFA
jgi:hypothetical protein